MNNSTLLLFLALGWAFALGFAILRSTPPALAHEPAECVCPPPPSCVSDSVVQKAAAEAREAIRISVQGPQP